MGNVSLPGYPGRGGLSLFLVELGLCCCGDLFHGALFVFGDGDGPAGGEGRADEFESLMIFSSFFRFSGRRRSCFFQIS